MDVELLAQRLVAYSEQRDWEDDLVVRAGPAHALFFRFTGTEVDSVRTMSWEARANPVGRGDVQGGPGAWLTTASFRREGQRPYSRSIRLPLTIEYARLVASLIVFLIQRVYGVPAGDSINAALEIGPPRLSSLRC